MKVSSGYYIIIIILVFSFTLVRAQTNISGVINTYVAVNSISSQAVGVVSSTGFAVGDRVMLVQMKGAAINQLNTPAYGSVFNINDCGNYELATILSVSSNTITFTSPLIKTYAAIGLVQLVKVPVYTNATVTGLVSCMPWNGSVGGILAFECTGTLNMLANIDASGKGFRGGGFSFGTVTSCVGDTSNYVEPSSFTGSGIKGEGVFMNSSGNEKGRGPNGNGGGAGTNINGGGAGGANYADGGYGGNIKSSASCPPAIPLNCGGIYGRGLLYSNTLNKIFLGGGGGSGHMNDNLGTAGTNGGGIILIRASIISGNSNSIISNGLDNNIIAGIDGQGGGGAGGTILIDACSTSSLNIFAKGGDGGTDNYGGPDCHGKGGGGSGGVIWSSGLSAGSVINLNGGQPGIFTLASSWFFNTPGGATAGQPGGTLTGLVIPGAVPLSSGSFSITTVSTNNLCFNTSTATASVSTNGSGPYTYLWSPGNYTTASVSNLASGLYTVNVNSGCVALTQTVLVTSPSSLTINVPAVNLCIGQSTVLSPVITGGTPTYTVQWMPLNMTAASVTVSPSSSTDYTIHVNDSNGCATQGVANVSVTSTPAIISTSVNHTSCGLANGSATVIASPANNTYIWNPAVSNAADIVDSLAAGNYTVVVVNGACQTNTIISVFGSSPLAIISGSITPAYCNFNNGSITVTDNQANSTYSWTPGVSSTIGTITHLTPGSYSLTVINSGCITDSVFVVPFISGPTAMNVTVKNVLCQLDSGHIYINSATNGTSPYLYSFNNLGFSSNTAYTNLSEGMYVIAVKDSNGCVFLQTYTVAREDMSVKIDLNTHAAGCESEDGEFMIKSISGGTLPYLTSFNNGPYTSEINFGLLGPGTYTLNILDSNKCKTNFVLTMPQNKDDYTLYIPNSFTPNKDLKNDVWFAKGSCISEFKCLIYNRWGEKLVELKDLSDSWDGTYKGALVPNDVYVYLIEMTVHQELIKRTGHITVFR